MRRQRILGRVRAPTMRLRGILVRRFTLPQPAGARGAPVEKAHTSNPAFLLPVNMHRGLRSARNDAFRDRLRDSRLSASPACFLLPPILRKGGQRRRLPNVGISVRHVSSSSTRYRVASKAQDDAARSSQRPVLQYDPLCATLKATSCPCKRCFSRKCGPEICVNQTSRTEAPSSSGECLLRPSRHEAMSCCVRPAYTHNLLRAGTGKTSPSAAADAHAMLPGESMRPCKGRAE